MRKYNEKISDDSLWITATPSPLATTLPFYITEAGHFRAECGYSVERSEHNSFLLLYTINGCGKLITDAAEFILPAGHAVIIDCHNYHKYLSCNSSWEFYWIHFKGNAAQAFFKILYPGEWTPTEVNNKNLFYNKTSAIISNIKTSDICADISLSEKMHGLFNILINSAIENNRNNRRKDYKNDIDTAVNFIKAHYSQNITIDDIIYELHISKYHFIRLFKSIMGVTPYNYLTSYRINMSKTLLCQTDKPISEIAEECGFLDTSNFITHFKKRTGCSPAQYRKDF